MEREGPRRQGGRDRSQWGQAWKEMGPKRRAREGGGQVVYKDGKVVKGTWVKDMMHGTFLVKTKNNCSHSEVWTWGNCDRKQGED